MAAKNLIRYEKKWEWGSYLLELRPDGLWRYERRSQIQGTENGRVSLLRAPADLRIGNAGRHVLRITDAGDTKADYLAAFGEEVRCLRRGTVVK